MTRLASATAVVEVGAGLIDLAEDQAEWSRRTFGADFERGPIGALCHLEREAVEAVAAWNAEPFQGGPFLEELADCLLLLLDATRRGGLPVLSLIQAAQRKMIVNKSRTWPKTTGDVPTEHVR